MKRFFKMNIVFFGFLSKKCRLRKKLGKFHAWVNSMPAFVLQLSTGISVYLVAGTLAPSVFLVQ